MKLESKLFPVGIIIITTLVICGIFYLSNKTNNTLNKQSDSIYNLNNSFQNKTPAFYSKTGTKNDLTFSKQYTDIAKPLFVVWLEKEITKNGGLDYKINKIDFVAQKSSALDPEKYWFNQNDTNSAFIVSASYSVKSTPEKIDNYWIAGNREKGSDGWVLNKFFLITINKNSDGYYIKNIDTGP